jgi:hypothetical protein
VPVQLPLIVAETVEVHGLVQVRRGEALARPGLGIARVVEAGAVLRPGQVRELHPLEAVVEHVTGLDVDDAHRTPVRAAVLDEVGDLRAVGARHGAGQGHGAVPGPAVRVEQRARRAVRALLHEVDRLVLEAVVAREEDAPAALHRQREALEVEQLREAPGDRLAPRQGLEVVEGDAVLGLDPGGDGVVLAHVVLEPAVRVGDRDLAVGGGAEGLRDVRGAGRGIGQGHGGLQGGRLRGTATGRRGGVRIVGAAIAGDEHERGGEQEHPDAHGVDVHRTVAGNAASRG